MKYVQIAILALMLVSAGLLYQIYRSQNALAPAAEHAVEQIEPEFVQAPEVDQAAFEEPGPREPAPEAAKPTPTRKPPARRADPAPPPELTAKPPPAPPPPTTPAVPPPLQAAAVEVAGRETSPSEAAPPPEPLRVILPAGTNIVVRLDQFLSTERNYTGDSFYASLNESIVVDDLVIAEKGARVEGEVFAAEQAGRVKGRSLISLGLVTLHAADGQVVEINTDRSHHQGQESKTADAKKVGVGAGIGAIIGAIAGGGKGAAIGAGAGAGAGGATVAATRGKPVEIKAETRLTFRLLDPVEIVKKP